MLFGGSLLLGDCAIGDRVIVSANSTLINQSVESDRVVAGSGATQIIRPRKRNFDIDYFL